MPGLLPSAKDVIAILCADVHLQHKAPLFRSAEQNWYETMKRVLEQVTTVSYQYRAPVIIAGDLFTNWNSPAELISFAMRWLPAGICAIPGNHDLPHHNYKDLHRSAFGTLVEAGRIVLIKRGEPLPIKNAILHGFPCGFDVEPWEGGSIDPFGIRLAVIHDYLWIKGHSFPNAPKDKWIGIVKEQLQGYDAVVYGDNHKNFLWNNVLNAGTLMIRKSDEREYKPSIGLLHADGSITRHFLDTSQDKYLDTSNMTQKEKEHLDVSEFIDEMQGLQETKFDFETAVKEYMIAHKIHQKVRTIILKSLEGEK